MSHDGERSSAFLTQEINGRLERLEHVVFLLCDIYREHILTTDQICQADRREIADFYDHLRKKYVLGGSKFFERF